MKKLNLSSFPELKSNAPEKIIQFGEGNFIRAFIDWIVYKMNKADIYNGRIVAIQPTPHGKVVGKLNAQDSLFTTILRGIENGKKVDNREIVNSISRGINPYTNWSDVLKCAENPDIEIVFSNTTEAGLKYNSDDTMQMTPPLSYPAKLTLYLYHRYQYFNGAKDKGMYILPCELLENNGALLKNIILKYIDQWNLPDEFKTWLETSNKFYNTLVDRVVSGYPKDEISKLTAELNYEDTLIACGEPFLFFAIEGDKSLNDKLPLLDSGLNIVIEDNIAKYRLRKVRILNGGHTANVPATFLAGLDTVTQMMDDHITGKFTRQTIRNIILPSISLDKQMLTQFADATIERFQNPFIKHHLQSILLNCTAKFKARVLPSLIEYHAKFHKFPKNLCFAFAAYIYLYKTDKVDKNYFYIKHNNQECKLQDDETAVVKLTTAWKSYQHDLISANKVAETILADNDLWSVDLTKYPELINAVANYLYEIDLKGTKEIMQSLLIKED